MREQTAIAARIEMHGQLLAGMRSTAARRVIVAGSAAKHIGGHLPALDQLRAKRRKHGEQDREDPEPGSNANRSAEHQEQEGFVARADVQV
nr:hypothetical protein [Paraburkholderia tropica]